MAVVVGVMVAEEEEEEDWFEQEAVDHCFLLPQL